MAAPTRSTYDLAPTTDVAGFDAEAFRGVRAVRAALAAEAENACVVVVECYPGVSDDVCELVREAIRPDVVVRSEDAFYDGDELTRRMQPYLTEDRVRGVMYHGAMEDFIDPAALADARSRVGEARASRRRVLVFGVGATLVEPKPDLLVYCDLARWEIQLRYRAGMPNFK